MSIFSDNLRYLRAKQEISQQKLCDKIGLTRAAYQRYEDDKSQPPYEKLIKISNYYGITIDILLKIELRKNQGEELLKLNNRLLFPVRETEQGDKKIEIIPKSAQAGYTLGYGDPEFIKSLETISLPFLGSGKYRTFPISGDSMLPNVSDGSYVVCEYVEHLNKVKNGDTYIILTRDDGIVYKRVYMGVKSMKLYADNKFYSPYSISLEDIQEIWQFKASINLNDEESEEITSKELLNAILALKS